MKTKPRRILIRIDAEELKRLEGKDVTLEAVITHANVRFAVNAGREKVKFSRITCDADEMLGQYRKEARRMQQRTKLEVMFKKNLDDLAGLNDEFSRIGEWENRLESLGCKVRPTFMSAREKDHHRIEHPRRQVWILVPDELAEKILVLGGLP